MYFNPDIIKDEYLTAPVVFTDLKIYNQSVPISANGILKESITGTNDIYIPHGNDVITFEYALLDYFDVKRNTFSYKLDGFDIDWNSVGPRNSATYTNLPPGEYTFSVRATNNNGVKNEQEASIKVIIVPAFYQTLLFRLTIGFGLLFIVIMIYQIRTRAIKKQNKILEKKVTERTKDLDKTIKELNQEIASKDKFFSIIAHDLRSPFVALLGFSNHMVEEINNLSKDEMQVMAENILKSVKLTFGLLENLLQWARIKTGRINFEPEVLNLKIIFDKVVELFLGIAQSKDITLAVDISTNLYVFADLNMVETILRNLISNSIKFTDRGGKITISATEENNFARIRVKDTGIGINTDKLEKLFQINENISTAGTQNESGSGLGLILCKEFIEINKGQISVNSSIGKGSEFSFILPKINNSLN
jgi:signal transduction histidine kinase